MSDFPTRQEPGSLAPVEPLTFKTADGKLYERSASVQAELGRVLAMHSAEWPRVAPELQNESIVHIIWHSRDRDRELMGQLMLILGKRIHRLARSRLRRFDKTKAEDIIKEVQDDIFDLLLAPKPSLNSEFLEVAFAEAVLKRTLNAIRNHLRTPAGHRAELPAGGTDQSDDEHERQFKLLPDGRANPDKAFIQAEEEAGEAASLEKARQLVKDPSHWEAIELHHGKGMPIVSSNPNEIDLMRYLGASEWTIKYRIRAGLKAIRKAFGDQNDKK